MKIAAVSLLLMAAATTIAASSNNLRSPSAAAAAVGEDIEEEFVEQSSRRLLEDDEPCVSNFKITTKNRAQDGYGTGSCDGIEFWDKFSARVSGSRTCTNNGRTNLTEASIIAGTDIPDEATAIAYLNEMCLDALKAYQAENQITWPQIVGEETNHFIKELMDGNTDINTGLQTPNVIGVEVGRILDDWGDRFKDVHDDLAKKRIFDMPEGITNFPEEDCTLGAAMCCWASDRRANDDNGNCATPYYEDCLDADPANNTDLCSVDMARAPSSARVAGGTASFPGDTEGDVHCHGLAWSSDPNHASNIFKSNNLFYVSLYDHFRQRGYVRNLPGAPMCSCIDQSAIVSRSDCTEITANEISITWYYDVATGGEFYNEANRVSIAFNACNGANDDDNNLEAYYERLVEEGRRTEAELTAVRQTLVGTCPA